MMRKWWIDQSLLMAGSNPGDDDLAQLRSEGFRVAVSLLDAKKQRPRYDDKSAASAGWAIYPIPLVEGTIPSLVQVCEFAALMGAVSKATKSLVFCDDGLGCAAFMGAAYWIAKGLTANAAMARITSGAGVDRFRNVADWEEALRKFEQLGWRI